VATGRSAQAVFWHAPGRRRPAGAHAASPMVNGCSCGSRHTRTRARTSPCTSPRTRITHLVRVSITRHHPQAGRRGGPLPSPGAAPVHTAAALQHRAPVAGGRALHHGARRRRPRHRWCGHCRGGWGVRDGAGQHGSSRARGDAAANPAAPGALSAARHGQANQPVRACQNSFSSLHSLATSPAQLPAISAAAPPSGRRFRGGEVQIAAATAGRHQAGWERGYMSRLPGARGPPAPALAAQLPARPVRGERRARPAAGPIVCHLVDNLPCFPQHPQRPLLTSTPPVPWVPAPPLHRQFRPPLGQHTIELPAGLVDGNEAPEAAALRELREETGYAAARVLGTGGRQYLRCGGEGRGWGAWRPAGCADAAGGKGCLGADRLRVPGSHLRSEPLAAGMPPVAAPAFWRAWAWRCSPGRAARGRGSR
jgi:hypothetical protein